MPLTGGRKSSIYWDGETSKGSRLCPHLRRRNQRMLTWTLGALLGDCANMLTQTFTLEKLDSCMLLNHDRKMTATTLSLAPTSASREIYPLWTCYRPSHSRLLDPCIAAPPRSLASKETGQDLQDVELDRQLQQDLLALEDALQKPPTDCEEIVTQRASGREDQVEPTFPPPHSLKQSSHRPSSKASAIPSRALSPGRALPAPMLPQSKGKTKLKREREIPTFSLDVEEEELAFGQPSRPTKRARSPSQTGGNSRAPQPSTVHSPPNHSGVSDSDEEEDWDEVAALQPTGSQAPTVHEDDEDDVGGTEIDLTQFEQEMNEHLGASEEDYNAATYTEPPVPISLNQLASRGGEVSQDEDDYTSSEESDED
jgi:neural Wiskott-Aldrich syndrome protein